VFYHNKGTYCLLIYCREDLKISVGALGKIRFRPGFYLYAGSALKGMDKRISRHLKKKKKVFWHIDRITSDRRFFLEKIYYIDKPQKLECIIAKKLAEIFCPVIAFGSSDCKCSSHLFFAGEEKTVSEIGKFLIEELGFDFIKQPKEKD